jgi:hypothetical protein
MNAVSSDHKTTMLPTLPRSSALKVNVPLCLGLPVFLTWVADKGKLLVSRSDRLVSLNEVDDIRRVRD